MSTIDEKYRAFHRAERLLKKLAASTQKLKLQDMRELAKKILRHWPCKWEISIEGNTLIELSSRPKKNK